MKCLFGIHEPEQITIIEMRAGDLIEVRVVRCARCWALISEEVRTK